MPLFNLPSVEVIAASAVAVVCPNDLNDNVLASIVIPPMGANDAIRVLAEWSYTSSANWKSLRLRYNAGTGFLVSTATSVSYQLLYVIQARNSLNSQIGQANTLSGLGGVNQNPVVFTADTTLPVTLDLCGQLSNLADSITLERYIVERIRRFGP